MRIQWNLFTGKYVFPCIILMIFLTGCSLQNSVHKPETGPIGGTTVINPNPPLWQRFSKPPVELYDLEAFAGLIYENSQIDNWLETKNNFAQMQATWQNVLPAIGEKKGVSDCNTTLPGLATAIANQDGTAVYQQLNKFMSGIGEIGESYQLAPLSSIVAISNGIRDVNFSIIHNDWQKAEKKSKEMESNWGQQKPGFEKVGILGEITKTHSFINKIKSAIAVEDKEAAQKQLKFINKSMGRIRDYYRGD